MAEKKRLDILLFEKGLAESREKAKAIIMSGIVYVDNQKSDKPGTCYPETAKIEVRGNTLKYVSRGGLKLEKAVEVFDLELSGVTAMDIGASHGGFTDCMLQHGAKKVFAIDVGYGQLAWKLRSDERVVNLERTNFRYVTSEQITEPIDFFSVDVSFISLKLILPVAKKFVKQGGKAVCLIKPQFEAGKGNVGKNGVVRDPKIHTQVIEKIVSFAKDTGYSVLGLDFSPVKGPEGNIEYLLFLGNYDDTEQSVSVNAEEVVRRSHETLDK
ncbi:MAG: TlyA family RNA methyltransferase [Clostridia bacterium]|nr:TlyA family RNA methyltransferase [Clostridia bacterium]MBQ2153392.1 TlyA family RNA methyltransferase [Clostridia bacterium]